MRELRLVDAACLPQLPVLWPENNLVWPFLKTILRTLGMQSPEAQTPDRPYTEACCK